MIRRLALILGLLLLLAATAHAGENDDQAPATGAGQDQGTQLSNEDRDVIAQLELLELLELLEDLETVTAMEDTQ